MLALIDVDRWILLCVCILSLVGFLREMSVLGVVCLSCFALKRACNQEQNYWGCNK